MLAKSSKVICLCLSSKFFKPILFFFSFSPTSCSYIEKLNKRKQSFWLSFLMFEEEMLWFWVLLKTESFYAGQTELPSNNARKNAGNRRWGRACFLLDVLGRLCLQTQGWVGWTAASPGPSVPAHQYLEAGVQWAHSLARLGDSPQMLIAPWEGSCSERPSAGYCSDPTSWAPFTCFNQLSKKFYL